jgi:GDPmannose 4,6-dehydratase
MISSYLIEQLNEYSLYGITRNTMDQSLYQINIQKNIIRYEFDMNNNEKLTECILSIKPDIIIHLASISSSHYAFNNPLETIEINGLLSVKLCDIIHKYKLNTKLFNASSSEIYKGHVDYLVKEDDKNMRHLHPYSIAKIMGHTMVEFYRNTYDLPFSNGIIFTTESERKRPEFLLNKIKQHAKIWKTTKIPLTVGSLESHRNILHANDVASAIKLIIQQIKGDDYLICNDYSIKIYELVIKIYLKYGISIENRDNILYDVESGDKVVIIEDKKIGFDISHTNIRGKCTKLKQIGWKPNVSLNEII